MTKRDRDAGLITRRKAALEHVAKAEKTHARAKTPKAKRDARRELDKALSASAACTLALSPIRDTLIEGFSHFVTSMTAPIASGWSGCRVGFAPTGKRRLCTAHALNGHAEMLC